MEKAGERIWLPWADWLLMGAILASLLLVILPLLIGFANTLPVAAAAASCIAVAGYIPSLLAHYRIIFGAGRSGPRTNPEPWECFLVISTAIAAIVVGGWAYVAAT